MAVLGLGIDVVALPRFRRVVARNGERFLEKHFTAGEREYCARYKDPAPHLAARFAAKEATTKALGTGIGLGVRLCEIEVVLDGRGRPGLSLHGGTADVAREQRVARMHLSLSHDGDAAAAVVVLEGGE